MAKDVGDLLQSIYTWGIQDKIIHDGAVRKSPFQVGETITGSTSGATAVIDTVGKYHLKYTLSTALQFRVNETITGATSGATCTSWKINQLHTSIEDRLYFQEAPEEPIPELFPYVVYEIIGSTSYHYLESSLQGVNAYEKYLVSFFIYSNESSSQQITLLNKQLGDLYDKAELSISNWTFKYSKRNETGIPRRDMDKIWTCVSDFEFVIQ